MARPASVPITRRATTGPSSWTPTAITWRPFTTPLRTAFSNGGLAGMRDPVKPGSAVDAYGLAVSTLMAVIAEWAVVPPWLKKQPVRSCAELVR
jgi:hypothetical protein